MMMLPKHHSFLISQLKTLHLTYPRFPDCHCSSSDLSTFMHVPLLALQESSRFTWVNRNAVTLLFGFLCVFAFFFFPPVPFPAISGCWINIPSLLHLLQHKTELCTFHSFLLLADMVFPELHVLGFTTQQSY